MNWEETILYIRTQSEFRELVEHSYLGDDLKRNVARFQSSSEFAETLKIVREFAPEAKRVLDVGGGNGIGCISFALAGYEVTVVEPDKSSTVGCGAIEFLKNEYGLSSLRIVNSFGESLPVEQAYFDIVYIRQAMHHAADLEAFLSEASRVLKPGGLLLTIRDHVIFGPKDKQQFLDTHPLQKFYGGENAFTPREYSSAMRKAGLSIKKQLKYYDSVINYFPSSEAQIINAPFAMREHFRQSMQKRFGLWVVNFPFLQMMELISMIKNGMWNDERRIPGRMHSFIAIKNIL